GAAARVATTASSRHLAIPPSRRAGFAVSYHRLLLEAGLYSSVHTIQPLGPGYFPNSSSRVSGTRDPRRKVSSVESAHMGRATAGGPDSRRPSISVERSLLSAAVAERIFADGLFELVLHSHPFSGGGRRLLAGARPGAKPRGFDPGRLRILFRRLPHHRYHARHHERRGLDPADFSVSPAGVAWLQAFRQRPTFWSLAGALLVQRAPLDPAAE